MREILFKAKIKNWRELPTGEQWVDGYNACIDKILEGGGEE